MVMEKQTFFLADEGVAKRVCAIINAGVRRGEEFQVTITPEKEEITAAQRRTYWMWLTEIGNELGDTKEYYHRFYKKEFLVNIYRRDDEGYEAMIQAWIAAKKHLSAADAKVMGEWILDNTSITGASRAQMSEFLESIKIHAATEFSFAVTIPDDGLLQHHENRRI
jgi:hypothetical protein